MGAFYALNEQKVKKQKKGYFHPGIGNVLKTTNIENKIGMLDKKDEEMQRKRMDRPFRFVAPHAGVRKERKYKRDEDITLLELSDSFGGQEIKTDMDGTRMSFTAVAQRPDETGMLREDMRNFNRYTAKKQRRISDTSLFLAGGKKEGAASVEFEQSRKWTDSRMKLMQGEGRSSMLEAACPYADDTREKEKLVRVKEELDMLRKIRMQNSGRGRDEGLLKRENYLVRRVEELTELLRKKEYVKRVMLQKFKYATNPAGDRRFYARIRQQEDLGREYASAGRQEVGNEDENQDETAKDELLSGEDGKVSSIGDDTQE